MDIIIIVHHRRALPPTPYLTVQPLHCLSLHGLVPILTLRLFLHASWFVNTVMPLRNLLTG